MKVIGRVARLAVAAAALLAASAAAQPAPGDPPLPAELEAREGVDRDRLERARREVLDERYQSELPRYRGTGSGGTAMRPDRRAGGELPDRRGSRTRIDTRHREESGGVSSLLTVMMWGMVIVIVVLVVSWLASELFKGGDAELPPEEEPHARMQAAVDAIIDRPLGDADDLARRGEFAEAIHTLLLRTLQELVRSAAVRVAPATTSREILARVPLLADARSALAGLITAVEITHFGDEPANAADYERCRQQFHVFAAALRNPGPRAVAA